MKLGRTKKGIATIELAICLPIIVSITLAVIETSAVFNLKKSATLAAYEGARVGIRKGGTNDQVQSKVEDFLDARNINYGSSMLTVSNPGFDSAATMEHVSVTVTLPCTGNTVTSLIFNGQSVSAAVTMRKEYTNL
ncbi:MAG: TadE family protein [Planctomycetota bacterium]